MSQIEQLQDAIKQLTGAVNLQHEMIKNINQKLKNFEDSASSMRKESSNLSIPTTEQDLKEIAKLPDCVKELQVFDGNPAQYVFWVHTVESILADYSIVKDKPIYRAILQNIRQRIRGQANSALISYNIFDGSWDTIKECLSLHYADKRDLRTLEHQMNNLMQANLSIEKFYAMVNNHFSLIVNKIKIENYSSETVNALIETYRNRALDVFMRGLRGDLSKMLFIQRPQTLPEAYAACIELQNLNFRNTLIHKKSVDKTIRVPENQIFGANHKSQDISERKSLSHYPTNRNKIFDIQHNTNHCSPQISIQQEPPMPMEVDSSLKTRKINYFNRPNSQNNSQESNNFYNTSKEHQRVFNIETQKWENLIDDSYYDHSEYSDNIEEENLELNFMMSASLAFPT